MPLQVLNVVINSSNNYETVAGFISNNREKLYQHFNAIREVIIDNYIINKNIAPENYFFNLEPSFISSLFGIQGRLDLMVENRHTDKTRLDIVELKSSKPPNNNVLVKLGVNEQGLYKIYIPLWINHYIQIICYNMLLKVLTTENNDYEIGLSAILYSNSNDDKRMRNVVDNDIAQQEIIKMRN